jgi:hypothetical protein
MRKLLAVFCFGPDSDKLNGLRLYEGYKMVCDSKKMVS